MTKRFLFAFLVLLFAAQAQAANYWVDATNGSDGNGCNASASPLTTTAKATIQAGLACLSGGDTLSIRAGTYAAPAASTEPGPSGSSWSAPTIITNHTAEQVNITGAWPQFGNTGARQYVSLQATARGLIKLDATTSSREECIWIGSSSGFIRIQNLEITGCLDHGVVAPPSGIGSNEFINNYVHTGGRTGGAVDGWFENAFYLGTPDNLVERNEVTAWKGACYQIYTGDASVTDNTIVRFNTCHDTSGQLDNSEAGQGIILANGTNLRAYGNLVWNLFGRADGCCGAIQVLAPNALVYNNTAYNNKPVAVNLQPGYSGIELKNNALWQNGLASGFDYPHTEINDDATSTTKSNNLCTTAATGCSVTSDPLFVNAAAADFALQSGSPAKDAGATLGSPYNVDYLGVTRPQGASYDIGAYEFAAGSVATPRAVRAVIVD